MSLSLDALTAQFSLSVLTATKGHASKRLVPDVNNRPIKDPAHTLGISAGRVEHVEVAGLTGFGDLLQRITPQQALVHGIPKDRTPGAVLTLVLAEKYTGAPGTVARTLGCIGYPPGVRLIMCDYDPAPEAPESIASAQELVARLAAIWPVFADVGWLATTSTSSAIRCKVTGDWLKPPEGMHVYLLATGDVARFRELAKVRLWLTRTGYCKLSQPNAHTGVPNILERCLIDLTVFSPERLDYVAGAQIAKSAPFYQVRPAPALQPGLVLDLDSLPDVTEDERADYARLVAEARARVAPEQRAKVRAHIATATPTLPDAEVEQEITTRLDRAERGDLDADQALYFDNGTRCTAGTLTKAFDGKRLRDPLEPDYGPSQAVFHWRTGGADWRIVSWAHGVKKVYRLVRPETAPPLPDDEDMDDLLSRVGDADAEDLESLAAGARQDDDARGLAVRYRATPGGLVWSKPTKDGVTDVLLTNFTATIAAETTEDDGVETRLLLALEAQRDGHLTSFTVPAAHFHGMAYGHDCGALTREECRAYWERTWQALGDAAAAQQEHQAGEEPVGRFLTLLAGAIAAGHAHVADARTLEAPRQDAEYWGWRERTIGTGDYARDEWQPLGPCIGWLHETRLYLEPEAVFYTVQRFAEGQQAPLSITQRTLWKRMREQRMLVTQPSQQQNTVSRAIGPDNKSTRVLDISAALLSPENSIYSTNSIFGSNSQKNKADFPYCFPVWYGTKQYAAWGKNSTHAHAAPPMYTNGDLRTDLCTDLCTDFETETVRKSESQPIEKSALRTGNTDNTENTVCGAYIPRECTETDAPPCAHTRTHQDAGETVCHDGGELLAHTPSADASTPQDRGASPAVMPPPFPGPPPGGRFKPGMRVWLYREDKQPLRLEPVEILTVRNHDGLRLVCWRPAPCEPSQWHDARLAVPVPGQQSPAASRSRAPQEASTPAISVYSTFTAEVKARANGSGFKQLEAWLAEYDMLFLRRDRKKPMVILPWNVYTTIMQAYQSQRTPNDAPPVHDLRSSPACRD